MKIAPIEMKVPDIGDVTELMVKVDDAIKAEQNRITVESDKTPWKSPRHKVAGSKS